MKETETVRFGVSMDAELLDRFDRLCERRGYATRSEAIRDSIRAMLAEEEGEAEGAVSAGTLTLVYDHHRSDIAQRLTEEQHRVHGLIIASLHAHLDHDNCLEVLLLRGPAGQIGDFARRLLALKGVLHGKFILAGAGEAGGNHEHHDHEHD